jgi:hypothetical protein
MKTLSDTTILQYCEFDWLCWLAKKLNPEKASQVYAEYDKIKTEAWAVCQAEERPAWDAYTSMQCMSHCDLPKYMTAVAPLRAAYLTTRKQARARYRTIEKPAYKICRQTMQSIVEKWLSENNT